MFQEKLFYLHHYRLDPLKEAMDADGKIDAAKLEAWIIKSQIDPNDSDNEELMSRLVCYQWRM